MENGYAPPESASNPDNTADVLKTSLAGHDQTQLTDTGTGRLTKHGKESAKQTHALLDAQGHSAEDIRQAVAAVRQELKGTLKDRKNELRALLKSEVKSQWDEQGQTSKGRRKELNAAVRERLVTVLATDAVARSVVDTRKLLTNINARVRSAEEKSLVEKISDNDANFTAFVTKLQSEGNKKVPQNLTLLKYAYIRQQRSDASTQSIPQQKADETEQAQEEQVRITMFEQKLLDRQADLERKRTETAKKLGWRGSFSFLRRPALKRVAVAGIALATVFFAANRFATSAQAESPPPSPAASATTAGVETPRETLARLTETNAPEVEVAPPMGNEEAAPAEAPIVQETVQAPQAEGIQKIDELAATKQSLTEIVKKYNQENRVGISLSVRDVTTGDQLIDVDAGRVDIAASTAKLYTAAAALDAVAKGELRMDERIGNETVAQLLAKMVNRSDNDAWKAFYKKLGLKRVESFAQNNGATNFNITENTTSADDLATFLANLYNQKILPETQTKFLFSLMAGGTTSNEQLLSPSMRGKEFYHKWGGYDRAFNDAGIVVINGRVYAVVMTTSGGSFITMNGVTNSTEYSTRIQAFRDVGTSLVHGLEQVTS